MTIATNVVVVLLGYHLFIILAALKFNGVLYTFYRWIQELPSVIVNKFPEPVEKLEYSVKKTVAVVIISAFCVIN